HAGRLGIVCLPETLVGSIGTEVPLVQWKDSVLNGTIVSASSLFHQAGSLRALLWLLWSGQTNHSRGTLLDLSHWTTCFGHWSFMRPAKSRFRCVSSFTPCCLRYYWRYRSSSPRP